MVAGSEAADAQLSLSRAPRIELANETSAHPGKLVKLDAALRGIEVDSPNFSSPA
jgi:hypothetical protein